MGADFLRLSRLLDLSAENRIITNIGNAGTDFDTSGGLALAGNLVVEGNFSVNGTTTTVNSTTLLIDDKNIDLAHSPSGSVGNNAAVDGGGISLISSQGNKTFNWVNSTSAWTSSEHLNLASGKSFYLNGIILRDVTETLTNKTLTSPVLNVSVSGTAIKDEDNMSSNSATHLATQQSIKAYIDAGNTLGGLTDVTITSVADNNFFQYDSSISKWVNRITPEINDSGADHQYIFAVGNLAANRTITLPVLTGGDTFVFEAHTQTLTNKTLTSPVLDTGISGSAFKDEDDMSSNSNVSVASQQSIKAYIDTQLTAEDLDVTTDSGTIAIDLDSEILTIAGGTGLGSSATGNTVTLAIDSTVVTLTGTQTLTNKTLTTPQLNDSATDHQYIFAVGNLVADRTVTFPVLTGNDTFVFEAHTQTLTNKTLTSPVLDTSISGSAFKDEDNFSSNSNVSVASQQSIKAYVDTQITAQDLDVTTDSGTIAIDLDSEIFTIAGGTGLGSSAASNTVTLAIDSTVVTLTGTQTLTNKTLTSPVLTTPQINDSATDHQYIFVVGNLAADRTVTLPLLTVNDTFVFEAHTQTLTNKTLTNPVLDGTLSGTAFLDEDNFTSNSAIAVASQQSIAAYIAAQITAEDLDVTSDSGTIDIDLNSETLTIAGGTGLDSAASGTTVTLNIDSTVATLTGTQTLTNKTLTAPKIVNDGFIADANGAEQIIFVTTGSAVNELTITNGSTGVPATIASSGESNIGLRISGSGTGGVILHGVATKGSYLEFGVKQTTVPDDPSTELARMYLKEVDSNNNAIAVKIQKAGIVREVEITSPKAVCAICGSEDGAKDPIYNFAKSIMILDLWCGHSFEIPMQWSQINGD